MKTKTIINTLVVMILATACSTARYFEQTASDVNFQNFKTYAFLPQKDTMPFSVYNSDIVRENTVKQIVKEMNSRGYELDTSKPDLLILPHFMFERKSQTIYAPAYPSYSYWYPGFYVDPWMAYYYPGYIGINRIDGTGMQEIDYTEGTIVIDVIENNNKHRLIWRGWSEDAINPVTFTQDIGWYIRRIFAKYPIKEQKE